MLKDMISSVNTDDKLMTKCTVSLKYSHFQIIHKRITGITKNIRLYHRSNQKKSFEKKNIKNQSLRTTFGPESLLWLGHKICHFVGGSHFSFDLTVSS